MGKPYPLALRERAVAFVEEGNSHRSSAAHSRVSVKFVNDMVKLKRETGSLQTKSQGRRGHGKFAIVAGWLRAQINPPLQQRLASFEPRCNANVRSGCTDPRSAACCTGSGSGASRTRVFRKILVDQLHEFQVLGTLTPRVIVQCASDQQQPTAA